MGSECHPEVVQDTDVGVEPRSVGTMTTERPLLGVAALTGNVYVYMRNGTKRLVPENELVTVIAHYLNTHDLVVTKDGYRVRYGVEEILPEPDDRKESDSE